MSDNLTERVEGLEAGLEEFQKVLRQYDTYTLKKLAKAYEYLITKATPYPKGARVSLTKSPEIGKSSAWNGARHFLIKGAVATVGDVDYDDSKGGLNYGLFFDDESWIGIGGEVKKVSKKGLYYFDESFLEEEI